MKPLSTIQTLWGESFVGFHHRLYHQYAIGVEHFNASDWFKFQGKSAKEYYPFLLSLFVCHGVLLEDFITNPDEEVFAQEVVLPSFQEVERRFGLRPLIARIYSDDELEETHSWCYPESMKEEVSRHAY
jgi:hypothetical protein